MAETASEQHNYPNLNPHGSTNGNSSAENAKNTAFNTAQSAMSSIQNSQTVQNLANGPIADKARMEANNTSNEFSNLANARQTPDTTTATGQNLTHYHSMFYSLLSWEHPRATAISFVSIILVIFGIRYLPIEQYLLKGAFTVLGITAAAEIAGKLVFGQGFATKVRPRKYYTIPRETLESMLGDVEELINFFVIEFQRIIFAENVYATIAAFFTALVSYFLVKVTPKWGLAVISTCVIYLTPLIYIKNKDFIDGHLNNASSLINEQAGQVRDLAAHHSSRAMEVTQNATKQYVAQAQEMMGGAKKQAVDKGYVSQETAAKVPSAPASAVKRENFPSAPSQEPAKAFDGAAETAAEEKDQILAE